MSIDKNKMVKGKKPSVWRRIGLGVGSGLLALIGASQKAEAQTKYIELEPGVLMYDVINDNRGTVKQPVVFQMKQPGIYPASGFKGAFKYGTNLFEHQILEGYLDVDENYITDPTRSTIVTGALDLQRGGAMRDFYFSGPCDLQFDTGTAEWECHVTNDCTVENVVFAYDIETSGLALIGTGNTLDNCVFLNNTLAIWAQTQTGGGFQGEGGTPLATIRGCYFKNNDLSLNLYSNSSVDLGTELDPGDNIFEGNVTNLRNSTGESIDAIWNDWSVYTEPKIRQKIEDVGGGGIRASDVSTTAGSYTEVYPFYTSPIERPDVNTPKTTTAVPGYLWNRLDRQNDKGRNDISNKTNNKGYEMDDYYYDEKDVE